MAFLLQCPSCGKEYNLPDAQRGKRVRCKDCSHTFVAEASAPAPTPPEPGEIEGISASRTSGDERVGTSRSSRRDPDEAKDRPKKAKKPVRKSDDSNDSSFKYILLLGGAAVFGVLACCGGGLFWSLYQFNSIVEEIAPNSTDGALNNLKSDNPFARQNGAAYFAKSQAVEEPRRKEVAAALEPLLHDREEGVRNQAIRGLAKWGTRDNAPTVLREVEAGISKEQMGDVQKVGMEALGNWKYEPAAPVMVKAFQLPFGHDEAEKGLRLMGTLAEPAVLKGMNDPSNDTSNRTRRLLEKDYRTSEAKLAGQCVLDLRSNIAPRMRKAAEWLSTHPPGAATPALRKEVALALDPLPTFNDREVSEYSVRALTNWLTLDNLNTLIKLADDERVEMRRTRDWAIDTLGKLGDVRAAAPLVGLLVRPGTRSHASTALKALGVLAEPEVLKGLKDPDKLVRLEACKILGVIGTNASVPDLEVLTKDPTEKQLASEAVQSLRKIKARGK